MSKTIKICQCLNQLAAKSVNLTIVSIISTGLYFYFGLFNFHLVKCALETQKWQGETKRELNKPKK